MFDSGGDSETSSSKQFPFVKGRDKGANTSTSVTRPAGGPATLPHNPGHPQGDDRLRNTSVIQSTGDMPKEQRTRRCKPLDIYGSSPARTNAPMIADSSAMSGPVAKTLRQLEGHTSASGHMSTHRSLSRCVSSDVQADDSDSDVSEDLSECSMVDTEIDAGGVAGVLSCLSLHPAHPDALEQESKVEAVCPAPLSLPGCSTAQQLAEVGAQDLRLNTQAKRYIFKTIQGKLLLADGSMTVSVELTCSELASAPVLVDSRKCVISIVPRGQPMIHGQEPRGQAQQLEDAQGWLFVCPAEAKVEILALFGQNGGIMQNLSDNYQLWPDAKAGYGSSSCVVHASCLGRTGRDVVVKILKSTAKESKILSEISMLTAAQGSPHIVKFLSAFHDQCPRTGAKKYSLVFESYSGDLYDRVIAGERIKERDAMPLAHNLLSAISFLQDRMIFHRDIKPENLLMTASGGVALTDFGIATHVWNLHTMSSERCTFGYASPEMLNGTSTGFEGDNFGAGIVIYFMLSKSTPFVAPTWELIAEKTKLCQVDMNYRCFHHLSQDCRNLILGLIRFKPCDRLSMAEALANKALSQTVTEPVLNPVARNLSVTASDAALAASSAVN